MIKMYPCKISQLKLLLQYALFRHEARICMQQKLFIPRYFKCHVKYRVLHRTYAASGFFLPDVKSEGRSFPGTFINTATGYVDSQSVYSLSVK